MDILNLLKEKLMAGINGCCGLCQNQRIVEADRTFKVFKNKDVRIFMKV